MALAGMENAVPEGAMPYPTWTRENLIEANPEWIIVAAMGDTPSNAPKPWDSLNSVSAVKLGQVRSIHPDWVLRPGPRIGKGVRALREAIQPLKKENR